MIGFFGENSKRLTHYNKTSSLMFGSLFLICYLGRAFFSVSIKFIKLTVTLVHQQNRCKFVENKTEDFFCESQVFVVNKIDKMGMFSCTGISVLELLQFFDICLFPVSFLTYVYISEKDIKKCVKVLQNRKKLLQNGL